MTAAPEKSNLVPTLLWMKASGNRRAMAWVAFQPVQCVGTITGMAAAREDDQSPARDVGDQGLVVEDQRIRLPGSAPPGLVDREAPLEAGGAVDLAGDEHRVVEEERRPPAR